MAWLKKALKRPLIRHIIALIGAAYLLLIRWTCLWQRQGFHHLIPYWKTRKPVIVVFWHNRMSMAPFAWRSKNPFFMLISPHSDGLIIARIVRYFGIQNLQGSPSHAGGTQALQALVRSLQKGYSVGVTPDGPRGPCEVLKAGVFAASFLSQCDVVALSFSTSRYFQLSSWDRFFIPLPFAKGRWVWSAPIPAPTRRDQKYEFMAQVKEALDKTSSLARFP